MGIFHYPLAANIDHSAAYCRCFYYETRQGCLEEGWRLEEERRRRKQKEKEMMMTTTASTSHTPTHSSTSTSDTILLNITFIGLVHMMMP